MYITPANVIAIHNKNEYPLIQTYIEGMKLFQNTLYQSLPSYCQVGRDKSNNPSDGPETSHAYHETFGSCFVNA